MPVKQKSTQKILTASLLVVLILLGLGWGLSSARAGELQASHISLPSAEIFLSPPFQDEGASSSADVQNSNCIMCHQYEQFNGITQDSLQVDLTVDGEEVSNSLHGQAGLMCVSCHSTITGYPHHGTENVTCEQCHEDRAAIVSPLPYADRREMKIQLNEGCRNCHEDVFSANAIHTAVAQSGAVNPPLCSDCHGAHDIQHPTEPPSRVGHTCGQCHVKNYADFQAGNHNNADPTTQTCADCHIPHQLGSAPSVPAATPVPVPTEVPADYSYLDQWNATCTMCHQYPSLIGEADDESRVSLTVSNETYGDSVHGQKALGCQACHESTSGYPHHETEQVSCNTCHSQADMTAEIVAHVPYESTRAMSLELNDNCRTCHESQFQASADSMHTRSLEEGNQQAPLCIDCHGSHDVQPAVTPPTRSVDTCSECHVSVHTSYSSSVHGRAVEIDKSIDAPTCADCHDGHSVNGPSALDFRNNSVGTCLVCHQDPAMMEKYGLSADLFDPNVDNYHSTPVSLFTQGSNDNSTDLVVCYDCHGSHTIQESDSPYSTVSEENITKTCQQCHPDASTRFANAGPAHSGSTEGSATALKWFNWLYSALLLGGFGLMMVYVALDGRKKRAAKKEKAEK